MQVLDVVAEWPGAASDARILANSALARSFNAGEQEGLLLGDSGYPLKPWLMVPFAHPSTRGEERYNR